jgi:predicted NUDIX family phosphoesterase
MPRRAVTRKQSGCQPKSRPTRQGNRWARLVRRSWQLFACLDSLRPRKLATINRSMMTETLVCLAARHVDSLGLAEGFSAVGPDVIERLFAVDQLWLGPRSWLETDESYRQLVSYVVFRHDRSVLVYRRTKKGGETRLHGCLSVGVGGHVNVTDVTSNGAAIDIAATLRRACAREAAEEIQCGHINRLDTVGVIMETITPVSRVHLGVVVECWLATPAVTLLDEGLVDARFVPAIDLAQLSDQMETWSSSLVAYLNRTAHAPSD